jgi:hypothetical protein
MVKQENARISRVIVKPDTMGELRDELLNVFTDLRNGEIDIHEAAELNNTAGKIINSVKVETEVFGLIKRVPTTKFITDSK